LAYTEGSLPSAYDYEFWERVTEIANGQDCRLYSFHVTHFAVGFFQDDRVPPDVSRWIARAADATREKTRFRLENALQFNNISSPIEQIFYVCWKALRADLDPDLEPLHYELSRHVLYPQFPLISPAGEEYLLDFAVMRFDAQAYRRLVREWEDRQDPDSDGNWIADPYPKARGEKCNLNLKIAIECDSYRHHGQQLSPAEFEYHKRRDRFLQVDGWTVLPFSGPEITRDPLKCVREVQSYLRRRINESSPAS
jgi:hypothetical protein